MSVAELCIILCMLLFNSAFAAYELALASISVGRLRVLHEQRQRGAASALAMKTRMEASLAVVQIGITLAGAIAAATGGAGADEWLSPSLARVLGLSTILADAVAIALIVLPLSAITIIIGELIPKTFALQNAEWVCLKLSWPMRCFAYLVYPAVLVFEAITKRAVSVIPHTASRLSPEVEKDASLRELRAQAQILRTSRIIGQQQEQMIVGASKLSTLRVRDIAVQAGDIVMLNADGKLTEHLVAVHVEAHTRFPVTERPGDPQAIIGYVNVKELFFLAKSHPANPSLREILRPLVSLPPDMPVGEAFTRMMADHAHLAVIRSPDGRVDGMLTVEDILEEVVGDIQDEFDRFPRYLTPSGKQWIVGGGTPILRIREALSLPGFARDLPDHLSVSEWFAARSPEPPKGGTTYTLDGLQVLARKVRRHKLMEGLIDRIPPALPSTDISS